MNIEEKRLFLSLVAKGAQTKAYRSVGLDKFSIREHLGRIAEYETDVARADASTLTPYLPPAPTEVEEVAEVAEEETVVCFDLDGNQCEDPSLCEEDEECDDA